MENHNPNTEIATQDAEIVSVAKSQEVDPQFYADAAAAAAGLKKLKPVMQLTAEYVELAKPGDTFAGVYAGITTINVADKLTGELKQVEAARFITEDKKMVLNAGWVLVNEIKKAGVPMGAPLLVEFKGKKENTKIYSVTLLG